MASVVSKLKKLGLISPPGFLEDNVQYEAEVGSVAYGVVGESSDRDIYGWCIPPKENVFPHLRGEILGFGRQIHRFEQYQQHHIQHEKLEYDITVYSIVKFFQLCMDNNPNMVDALFVPNRCVLHCTQIGRVVRDERKLFLHKGSYHKFRGYAYSQLAALDRKPEGKRVELVAKYGYDVKYAYHLVRLLLECEQILEEGDLDLEKHSDFLKAIRAGTWSIDQVRGYFSAREKHLEELYASSKLRYSPDEQALKGLLLRCLEAHYGSLDKAIHNPGQERNTLLEIQQVLDRVLK
jgi:uncharacterized protein